MEKTESSCVDNEKKSSESSESSDELKVGLVGGVRKVDGDETELQWEVYSLSDNSTDGEKEMRVVEVKKAEADATECELVGSDNDEENKTFVGGVKRAEGDVTVDEWDDSDNDEEKKWFVGGVKRVEGDVTEIEWDDSDSDSDIFSNHQDDGEQKVLVVGVKRERSSFEHSSSDEGKVKWAKKDKIDATIGKKFGDVSSTDVLSDSSVSSDNEDQAEGIVEDYGTK